MVAVSPTNSKTIVGLSRRTARLLGLSELVRVALGPTIRTLHLGAGRERAPRARDVRIEELAPKGGPVGEQRPRCLEKTYRMRPKVEATFSAHDARCDSDPKHCLTRPPPHKRATRCVLRRLWLTKWTFGTVMACLRKELSILAIRPQPHAASSAPGGMLYGKSIAIITSKTGKNA